MRCCTSLSYTTSSCKPNEPPIAALNKTATIFCIRNRSARAIMQLNGPDRRIAIEWNLLVALQGHSPLEKLTHSKRLNKSDVRSPSIVIPSRSLRCTSASLHMTHIHRRTPPSVRRRAGSKRCVIREARMSIEIDDLGAGSGYRRRLSWGVPPFRWFG